MEPFRPADSASLPLFPPGLQYLQNLVDFAIRKTQGNWRKAAASSVCDDFAWKDEQDSQTALGPKLLA
jgi:hypothetical protein